MIENWDNISEIMLEGAHWNEKFRLRWYKISRETKDCVYLHTQDGVKSVFKSTLNGHFNSYRVKYKNPLITKLNSL